MQRKTKKLRVAVIMGGPSAEHQVSLWSGKLMATSLDKKRYVPMPVVISKKGRWPVTPAELKKKADVALLALHGEYGEDGTVQRLFDKLKLPYTGSGARASALGMDKQKSQQAFTRAKIAVPPFVLARKGKSVPRLPFGFPVVVKPNDRGSSVGVSIVKKPTDLARALAKSFACSPTAMVQQFIAGREVTCGVLEIGGKPIALPPTEIIPKANTFFDFNAKYKTGGSLEITPARISQKETKEIQRLTLIAHRVIGCTGYSRSDFILTPEGKFYILEINTLPGMTATSLIPQATKVVGISYSKLLDVLIQNAL